MAEVTYDELEQAWWEWVDAGCPKKGKRARGKWMHENTFAYDGTTWHRDRDSAKSNTGKTTYTSSVVFSGADGQQISMESGRPLTVVVIPSETGD